MQPLRAQASSEFLIILAAVFVIAAITTALILQFSESNIDVRYRQSKVFWLNEKPIAIEDAKAYHNGLTLLVKNSGPRRILLKNISAQDEFVLSPNIRGYPNPIALEPGMRYRFDIPVTYSDTTNRRFVSLAMEFSYEAEAGKQEIGKEKLILPVPGACNVFGELCSEDSDCCGAILCRYGTCGGCAREGEHCISDSDCCSGFVCAGETFRACRPRPDLVPILLNSTSDPESPNIGRVRIANIGPGNSESSITMFAWSNATCPLPCETAISASTSPISSGGYYDLPVNFGNFRYGPPILCRNIGNVTARADSTNVLPETNELNNNLEFQPDCTACRGTNSYCSAALVNETCCAGLSCETPGIPGARCCVPDGLECSSPSDCCGGLTCANGVCITPGGPGDPCNNDWDCEDQLVCNPQYVCDECISPGQPCGSDRPPCCDGTYCSEIDDNTCAPCRQPGETCDPLLRPCCSGQCQNGHCEITELPDLVARLPVPPDENQVVGDSFTIDLMRTYNIGAAAGGAGTFTRAYSPSGGLVFNIDYLYYDHPITADIASGDGINSPQISVGCLSAGTKTLRVYADYGGTESESDESNNWNDYTIDCAAALPDLQADIASPPAASQTVGVPFNIVVRTRNLPSATASGGAGTFTRAYSPSGGLVFNNNPTYDHLISTNILIGDSRSSPSIAAVCTSTGSKQIRVEADALPPGPPPGVVFELDEGNNANTYTVNCQAACVAPDFVCTITPYSCCNGDGSYPQTACAQVPSGCGPGNDCVLCCRRPGEHVGGPSCVGYSTTCCTNACDPATLNCAQWGLGGHCYPFAENTYDFYYCNAASGYGCPSRAPGSYTCKIRGGFPCSNDADCISGVCGVQVPGQCNKLGYLGVCYGNSDCCSNSCDTPNGPPTPTTNVCRRVGAGGTCCTSNDCNTGFTCVSGICS